MTDFLPEAVFGFDREGVILYANRKASEITSYDPGELVGMKATDLITPETLMPFSRALLSASVPGEKFTGLIRMTAKNDARSFPARFSLCLSGLPEPGYAFSCVIFESVEEGTERAGAPGRERFRRLSDIALEGIVFHRKGKIVDANRAFCDMFGYCLEEISGMDVMDLVAPDYHSFMKENDASQNPVPCEVKGVRKNGISFDIEYTWRRFDEDSDDLFTVVVQDITNKKKVEFLQEHDELTGLLNLRGFSRCLKAQIAQATAKRRKFSVMTIRIEQDMYSVLKNMDPALERVLLNAIPLEIAERLLSVLFSEDIIARSGENEYMTINSFPADFDQNGLVKILNKLREVFLEEFAEEIHLSAHIGVTIFPDDLDTTNPNLIINNSHYACEEALGLGRDYNFYNQDSYKETRDKIEFAKDLIVAVRQEGCAALNLNYQPKVDRNGRIVGMEALVRWNHPRWGVPGLGFVPPAKFIHVAEEIGLIGEIGSFVMMEACRQTVIWHRKGEAYRHLQIAVNVSPSQLNDEFLSFLDRVLEETGLPPHLLEIEITERETVKEKNARILDFIKEKNISIAIDDFGIDYSVLSKLPKLSIDTIKLDKSYIDNIALDEDYEKLVNYTIMMAHGFKFNVVAEGVEDKDQAEKLFQEMGCDKIQGYYFFKPLTPEEYEKVLEANLGEDPPVKP